MAVGSHLDADARAEPGDGDGFLDAVTRQGIDHRALAGAPVAVVAVGLDGLVRSWNDAATRLLGWTADEVLGEVVPFLPEHNLDDAARALDLLRHGTIETVGRGRSPRMRSPPATSGARRTPCWPS